MHRKHFAALLAVVVFLLSSCSVQNAPNITKMEGNEITKPFYDRAVATMNENAFSMITKSYSEEELSEIVALQEDIQALNKLYPIECIRIHTANYSTPHQSLIAIYKGTNSIALVSFDENGEIRGAWMYNVLQPKEVFDQIRIGMPVWEVEEIAPEGRYTLFLTASGFPRVSEHYTTDGYEIIVTYNWDNDDLKVISVDSKPL